MSSAHTNIHGQKTIPQSQIHRSRKKNQNHIHVQVPEV
uniref:Uncharacterized protein n=1 Tax=Arundo donax TaxID=35708 RepID=A0A0A9CY91_ARUDO